MWSIFFGVVALEAFILFLPGFLFLKSFRLPGYLALACAPVFSAAGYGCTAIAYDAMGISGSALLVLLPVFLLAMVLFVFRVLRGRASAGVLLKLDVASRSGWTSLLLYVAVGTLAVTYIFLKSLDGPGSILQEWDNVHHLARIQTMASTGNFSSFASTYYDDVSSSALSPLLSSGQGAFYPSVFHLLAALAVNLLGANAVIAENAVLALFCGVVFPAAVFSFMQVIFGSSQRGFVKAGALVAPAFAGFPWSLLLFGGVFPNLISLTLVPVVVSFFCSIFKDDLGIADRFVWVILFIIGIIALLFTQTNAIFSTAVVLAPFCVYQAVLFGLKVADSGRCKWKRVLPIACGVMAFLVIAFIWCFLYSLPALQGVVSYNWPAITTLVQASVNSVLLSYTVYSYAQPLLAFLVFAGIFYCLVNRRYLWMVFAFLFASIIYIVDAGTEGFLKHLLSGFWYTDPFRTAATAVLSAVPLAAIGCGSIVKLLGSFVSHLKGEREKKKTDIALVNVCAGLAILPALFMPNYTVAGYGETVTAFGNFRSLLSYWHDSGTVNVLNSEEREFADDAFEMLPEGSVVLNMPQDGSAFLYGADDRNVYYRMLDGYVGDEHPESEIIREGLASVSSNEDVKAALSSIGTKYVLLLDIGGSADVDSRRFFDTYDQNEWRGFNSIDDSTPGFKILLSEGDMRLYEIEGV